MSNVHLISSWIVNFHWNTPLQGVVNKSTVLYLTFILSPLCANWTSSQKQFSIILYQIFKYHWHGLKLRKRNNREWEMMGEKVKCYTVHKEHHLWVFADYQYRLVLNWRLKPNTNRSKEYNSPIIRIIIPCNYQYL